MDIRSRSRRVLVVGWGFLGAAVGNRMRDQGMEVTALTRSESTRTHAARLEGIDVDIGDATDPGVLAHSMAGVDHVLCAAGGLLPAEAAEQPHTDARGTLSPLLTILETLRRAPTAGLTYLSSGGTVYGNPPRVPARETDPVQPLSAYGVSRLAGELYAQMYARTYGFPVHICRISNVYGPGQSPERSQGAVAVFLHRVALGLPLQIIGDGSAIRDYIHISDVADAVARIVAEGRDVGVVNIGSGRGSSVLGLARQVGTVIGTTPIIDFMPARSHDVSAIVLDITKLRSLIEYEPMGLHEGLRLTWHHLISSQLAADRLAPYEPVVTLAGRPFAFEKDEAAS